ncbi:rubredoxin-like domain-containing protein [Pelovirga terrestris]|nr:DUF2231 domain-containing protein [Pelovirga terrestris]
MRTWRCTICGYLHEGDSPPAFCPLCHATADKFELIESVGQSRSFAGRLKEALGQMRETFAPHAVSAHFPAALIPTAVLFLVLAMVSGSRSLEFAALALQVVIVVSIPVTMLTGFFIWQKNYHKSRSVIFKKKIALAWLLLLIASAIMMWRLLAPDLLSNGGAGSAFYLLLNFFMLACVTLLGHYGGMLVSAQRKTDG